MDDSTYTATEPPLLEGGVVRPFSVLLAKLHQNHIAYCYWKSSRRVETALSGESDLDLLVAKEDQYRAQGTLIDSGFKCFPAVAYRDHPAIASFLAHDAASGRIVHVHLHVRLVIGGKLFKNYRIPWEDMVLARAVCHPELLIRVLDSADEALLLVVRACLELRRTDVVALRDWTALRRKFELDRKALAIRLDRAELRDRALEVFPGDLADLVTDAVFGGQMLPGPRRLRRRVRRELAAWRVCNSLEASLRSGMRVAFWLAGGLNDRFFHLARPWRRLAPGGGCVTAVIGVDGSGKTTVVAAIREWLGAEVDVVPIYFGTGGGRPSLLLLPLKLMVPLFTRLLRTKPKGSSHGRVSSGAPGPVYSVLLMGWAGVLAVEKRIKLLAARRGAERGVLVIADRYPQDEDLTYNDGPLLIRLKWAPHWLRGFEGRAYALARRLPPDLVIKLDVTPETAATREPNMDPAVIRDRIEAARRLNFAGARVVRVDAEQPLAAVLRTVKSEIWDIL